MCTLCSSCCRQAGPWGSRGLRVGFWSSFVRVLRESVSLERKREQVVVLKKFSRQTDAATQGSSSSSSSVAAGSRDQGGRRGRRVSDKDYYYYYYSFDSLMCVIRRVDRKKISSAAKQLDCLIKSSLDIDGLHSVNLFCFVCIVFIPLQRGASPHHVLLQLGTLSKSESKLLVCQ